MVAFRRSAIVAIETVWREPECVDCVRVSYNQVLVGAPMKFRYLGVFAQELVDLLLPLLKPDGQQTGLVLSGHGLPDLLAARR